MLAVIPSSVLQVVDVKEISGIRGRLKQYYECNCSFKVNQETGTAVECLGVAFFEVKEKFCYLDDTIEARGAAVDKFLQ